jgi:membrane protein implicated in regulation of membrane protease activity
VTVTPTKANPNYILAAGIFALVLTLAAYIVCEVLEVESGPIIATAGPVIAALLLQNSLSRVESKTDQAVRNTNGALTGGIEEVVRRVYREEKAAETRLQVQVPVDLTAAPVPHPAAENAETSSSGKG